MDEQKVSGLWAKADDVQRWRDALQKHRDSVDALLNDLGDMQKFRISMAPLGDDTPSETGEAAPAVAQPEDEIPAAVAYAKAKVAKAKSVTAPTPAPEPADKAADGVKTRIRFPKFVKQLTEEHGEEVVNYAVNTLCPDDKTTAGLRTAMKGFLGVYKDAVYAGHAFGEAHGKDGMDAEEAVACLENAKHKLTDKDGRVAVWSTPIGEVEQPHVAPVKNAAPDESEVDTEAEAEDVDVDNFLADDSDEELVDDGITVELDDADA